MEGLKIKRSELDASTQAFIAQKQDYPEVQQLLFQTAKWLKSKQLTQWNALLEGKDVHNTKEAINNKYVVVFRSSEELLGTVTLFHIPSPWDKELWEDAEPALYVHRIAVNRAFSGQGYGHKIMQWIEYGLEHEKPYKLRLDCVATSQALNDFYSNLGFKLMGSKNGFNLYQKIID